LGKWRPELNLREEVERCMGDRGFVERLAKKETIEPQKYRSVGDYDLVLRAILRQREDQPQTGKPV
jgi:hypothetical protein